MKKKFWLIIPILAAFFVFLGTGQEHFYPTNSSIAINTNNVESYVDTDKGFVAIWNQLLLFATPTGEIQKALKPRFDGADCDLRAVYTDGDYVYVVLGTYMNKYSYYSSERVEKYSFSGKYLGQLLEQQYEEDDLVSNNFITDVCIQGDTAYITEGRSYVSSILSVPATPQKQTAEPEIIANISTDDFMIWGRYSPDEKKLTLFNRFGETYYYDVATEELSYHPELVETNVVKPFDRSRLFVSNQQKVMDILYYAGAVILVISLLIGLIRLLKTGILHKHWTPVVFLLFFVAAVSFYTNQTLNAYDQEVKERVISAAKLANQGFDFYLTGVFDEVEYGDLEAYKSQDNRDWIDWASTYLDISCEYSGLEMGMYSQIYVFDKNKEPVLLVDTFNEYPIGTPYIYGNYKFDLSDPDSFLNKYIVDKSIDGTYSYINYPIETINEETIGFFQMGSKYDRIRNYQKNVVIEAFLQLLAFVLFLYIGLDIFRKYSAEIKDYFMLRKSDPVNARISLSNTYDFLVSALMFLDFLLLIKVTASISSGSNMELAMAFAIPFTAYKIGSWIGSVSTSPLIGHFGERKMGIFSAIVTTITFAGLMFAVIIKNIYLLAGLKFVEGIFLESILFSIAEGIPYEIEDEERRNKKIIESQSATQGAMMITFMVAGVIAQYAGYAALYLVGGIFAALLIPLSIAILGVNNEEESNVKTLQVWKTFATPKVLLFILLMVMVNSFLCGYEEYLFPLFCETAGLSSIVLSSIGVLVTAASYFGEGVTTLFQKYTSVKAMVRALTVCGGAIILLVLNQNIIFAVIVYFVIAVLDRVIDSKKIVNLIDVAKRDGLEAKDIQENFYALEDGFKMLQGPVLGTLCTTAISLALVFLGLLTTIAPNVYLLISGGLKKQNATDISDNTG